MRTTRMRPALAAMMLSALAFNAPAQPRREGGREKPPPDAADVRYGPHERNVFDLWKARTGEPAPLLIFFHGGGFVGGNKTNLDPILLEECLSAGISVASANYRYSTQAPFPAPMLDGGRAIQFLRLHAAEWNLDPSRFAACGDSAGAGITLWNGYHPDLADPASDDPVARQSTRLQCLAAVGGQCSYDPRWIRTHIGGRAWEHPALTKLFGIIPEELDSPKACRLYEEAAPITYVSADDPPAFLYYAESDEPLPPGPHTGPGLNHPGFAQEMPGAQRPGAGIHHPAFGRALKEKLDPLHVECVVRLGRDYAGEDRPIDAAHREMVQFIARRLGTR